LDVKKITCFKASFTSNITEVGHVNKMPVDVHRCLSFPRSTLHTSYYKVVRWLIPDVRVIIVSQFLQLWVAELIHENSTCQKQFGEQFIYLSNIIFITFNNITFLNEKRKTLF